MYEHVFETSVRWRQFCSGFVRLIDVISRPLSLTVMWPWPVTKHLTHGTFVVKGETYRTSAIRCGSSRHINKTGHSGGHNWSYYPGTLSSSRVIWRSGTRKFHMWASGLQMSWIFESVPAYMVSYYSCQSYIPLSDGLKLWRHLQIQFFFWSKFHQRSCA